MVIGNGASVLIRSVGGQVLRSHTGGVLNDRWDKKKKGVGVEKVKQVERSIWKRKRREDR